MRNRVGAPARAVAVALLLLASALLVPGGPRAVAPLTPALITPAGAGAPAPRVVGFDDSSLSSVRNVQIDAGCNNSSASDVAQAVDPAEGILYEAWEGCGGIGFARSVDGGYSFGAPVVVPGSNGTAEVRDPSIAVAPNGTVYVGFIRSNGGSTSPVVAWSWDHGSSFAGSQPVLAAPSTELSDRSQVAVAPNGTLYALWVLSPYPDLNVYPCPAGTDCGPVAGDFNIVLSTSTDGGLNWSAPVPVSPGYPYGGAPAGSLLVEPSGAVDVVYESFNVSSDHGLSDARLKFVQSTDGGSSFLSNISVENLTIPNSTWWPDGALQEDASGTLYVGFDAPSGGQEGADLAISRSDGLTWSAPVPLGTSPLPLVTAMVGVAGGPNGTAYVAWLENVTGGSWEVVETNVTGNGSAVGPATTVSAGLGAPTEFAADSQVAVSDLGGGGVAVAWSYEYPVNPPGRTTVAHPYLAVVGEMAPVDAPRLTSVVPGAGELTVGWLPPAGPDRVDGYLLQWGIESQRPNNVSLPSTASYYTIAPLGQLIHWQIEVSAVNGAGAGPTSTPVVVMLTAWSVVKGSVDPANATVRLDGLALPVVNGSFSVNTTQGSHLLSAAFPDYTTLYDSVLGPWNGSVDVNLTLHELPGSLAGTVGPLAARVAVDGVAQNVSANGSYLVTGLAAGPHQLDVRDGGYVPFSTTVDVGPNATAWRNVTLLPVNATLTVTLHPGNGTVTVGGRPLRLNSTGVGAVTEPPNVYLVEASAAGYVTVFENVSLNQSESVNLTITLVPVPPAPPTSPPSPLAGYVIVALAAAVAVGVGVAALVVRRRRQGSRSESTAPDLWESDEGAAESPPAEEPPAESN